MIKKINEMQEIINYADDIKHDSCLDYIIDNILNIEKASDQNKQFTEEFIYNYILERLKPITKWNEDSNQTYIEQS
jgi:hypothetical protein